MNIMKLINLNLLSSSKMMISSKPLRKPLPEKLKHMKRKQKKMLYEEEVSIEELNKNTLLVYIISFIFSGFLLTKMCFLIIDFPLYYGL